jgi:tRNA/rRNA methyltransferase
MLPIIILIEPQMGENIGAAARAMKNFGFAEMRIVSPRDGWPNPKADSMSVGAIDIIQNAKIYDNIQDSIKDIEFLYATTAVERSINKNYVMAHEMGANYPMDQKVGIMFGRENCGLTNEEISYANMILSIHTEVDFSSLNIAHAVAIIAHEIWNSGSNKHTTHTNEQILATHEELEYFFEHLFRELDTNKFFKLPEKYPHMTQNIRNIFTRIDKLSKNELQTLRGIISSLSR